MSKMRLAIELISESVEELMAQAHLRDSDMALYREITTERRQREWLKSRAMVWKSDGKHIDYRRDGAPIIEGGYISISHTTDYVAVMLCDAPCGVDIENCERDASRIVRKFASPAEVEVARRLFPGNPELLVWCAKEAIYKYAGVAEAEFATDFLIKDIIDDDHGQGLVCIVFGGSVSVDFNMMDDLMVCSCWGRSVE